MIRRVIREFGIQDVANTGCWLHCGASRLRLAGVDDLWHGQPDVQAALGDATLEDATILLCHNPDYAETLTDPRVRLMLSGHMHGGQIYLPGYGAPWIPSRYGQKYLHGLVQAPVTQVFVSRGLGVVALPFRFAAPPEINLLTLVRATQSNG